MECRFFDVWDWVDDPAASRLQRGIVSKKRRRERQRINLRKQHHDPLTLVYFPPLDATSSLSSTGPSTGDTTSYKFCQCPSFQCHNVLISLDATPPTSSSSENAQEPSWSSWYNCRKTSLRSGSVESVIPVGTPSTPSPVSLVGKTTIGCCE